MANRESRVCRRPRSRSKSIIYTWDVLSKISAKTGNIVDYVVNELEWVKAQLSHAEAPNGPEDCRAPSVPDALRSTPRHHSLAHRSIYGLLQPASTAASKFFLLRPFRITCAPSRASASAMAQPIPELDPVTSEIGTLFDRHTIAIGNR